MVGLHKPQKVKGCVHFSICARHPCAGAMLVFPIPFQFSRMIPEEGLGLRGWGLGCRVKGLGVRDQG